ncbi:hypothetical protein E2C01_059896 [Portunus trituberculatus]|uniref:Uncharacterized protein n=1 Tax=Portunus trituberculatus TaxID=210409 RepID=A0A5B7H0S2_PORTR|nr:hypothetical protein [Portunus trituberculatus]
MIKLYLKTTLIFKQKEGEAVQKLERQGKCSVGDVAGRTWEWSEFQAMVLDEEIPMHSRSEIVTVRQAGDCGADDILIGRKRVVALLSPLWLGSTAQPRHDGVVTVAPVITVTLVMTAVMVECVVMEIVVVAVMYMWCCCWWW